MAKRKTQYVLQFQADPNAVNNIILSWLQTNGFKFKEKYDTKYYQSGDGIITTSRCFEYYFQGNQLTILAYLKTPKNPFPLDNGMVGVVNTMPYANLIQELMNTINNLSNQNVAYAQNFGGQNPSTVQMQGQQQYTNQAISNFEAENDKRQGNCAIWGLVLGCLNILLCLAGYSFGLFVLFIAYYLASMGLKSSKRGIAIAAIIIITCSLILFVMKVAHVI